MRTQTKPGTKFLLLLISWKSLRMTLRIAIHDAAKRRIPAAYHFPNVFHNNGTGMKSIFNFFVVFFKNLLEDVHKTIMKE